MPQLKTYPDYDVRCESRVGKGGFVLICRLPEDAPGVLPVEVWTEHAAGWDFVLKEAVKVLRNVEARAA